MRAAALAWCALVSAARAAAPPTNGTLCPQCAGKPRGHASRALDEFAMGALASLVYHESWANVSRSFAVSAAAAGGALPWRVRLRERARWLRCVARHARDRAAPPGAHPSAKVLRPRSPAAGRAPCPAPATRRWALEYVFRDWHEPGPARTKWHATTALVASSPEGHVAVAFAGSADARHAVTNLQLLARHGDGEGRTLIGMRGAFERVSRGAVLRLGAGDAPAVAAIARACAGRWTAGADGAPPECRPSGGLAALLGAAVAAALGAGARAYATGHSLGGALALQLALAALDAAPRRARRVGVFTFGEPPYGDRAFFASRLARHPRLPSIYDRRVAVTDRCRTDVVPDTTRLAGGGGHFAAPRYVCRTADAPRNVLSAHSMVGYYRGLRDHAARDFALRFAYDGPGFWGSDTPDDPLLVAAARKREAARRDAEAEAARRRRNNDFARRPLFPRGRPGARGAEPGGDGRASDEFYTVL